MREPAAVLSPAERSRRQIAAALVFLQGDSTAALALAKRQSLRDPLQASSFVVAALVASTRGKGQDPSTRALMLEARRRQPSLELPRLWLATSFAYRGRPGQAVAEIDRVLSQGTTATEAAIPVFVQMLRDPRYSPALLAKLGRFPKWRSAVVVQAIGKGALTDGQIEALLADSPVPGAKESLAIERQAYLAALAERGDLAGALARFRRYEGLSASAPVFDPNFRRKPMAKPLGWFLANGDLDYAERVKQDGGGWLVRAHASGNRNVVLLEQAVGLQPGSRTIRLRARDGGLAQPVSLALVVRCAATNAELARKSLGSLTLDEVTVKLPVTVPADCAVQKLAIEASELDSPPEGGSEIEILEFGLDRA